MQRAKLRLFLGSMILASSGSVYAAWSSGGGEVMTNQQNPWYIQNTTVVKYCIAIDEANFGQTKEIVQQRLLEALSYWKNEFKRADTISHGLRVATQDFIEISCDQSPDVAFQFGVLDQEQQKYLDVQNRHIVGIAVRTDYDEVNLKARGFVYIAPEFGPLAMRGPDLLERPWQLNAGRLIGLTLSHELGHVFGIQHAQNYMSLMSESFPSFLVQKCTGEIFAQVVNIPYLFHISMGSEYGHCRRYDVGASAADLLTIGKETKCVRVKVGKPETEIWVARAEGEPWSLAGKAIVHADSDEGRQAGSLVLSDRQRVFENLPAGTHYLPLTFMYRGRYAMTFLSEQSGMKSELLLDYDQDGISVSGVQQGGKFNLDVLGYSTWFSRDPIVPTECKQSTLRL